MTAFNVHSMPDLTYAYRAWGECLALESFNTLLPEVTDAREAWYNCSSLSSFGTTEIPNCSNFSSAWNGCSSLTSFPADAKLGTEATNVNFTAAWRNSGLTSFPADIDLSKGTTFTNTWRQSGLTSFSTPLPTATVVRSAWEDCSSLISFNTQLPLADNLLFAWDGCSSLTSFDIPLPSAYSMYRTWAGCSSLTDFSVNVFSNWNPATIQSGVFDFTWFGCTSLTADSVENILTSIEASGQHATSDGDAYVNGVNTQLADAGIDIDYDGTTLSAATNFAVTSLKAKGWSIIVNNVTL